jgi:alkylation response protein AidB-like acyl-CoA dehydrogenase
MTQTFADVHDELRAVARALLAKTPPDEPVDWGQVAAGGWLGLEVPEQWDGAGATFGEVAVILDEVGRAAAVGGYPATALAVGALIAARPGGGRDELLRAVAAGETTAALALPGDRADGPALPPFRLTGGVVRGQASFVLDAARADRLLLPARDDDGGLVLAAVAPGALTVTAQPVVDATRDPGEVRADDVAVAPAAVWPVAGDPDLAWRRLRDRAAAAIACDSLGLSETMLARTVEYTKVRAQFGRPIGSFQAVKHACADMLVSVAVSRRLVADAVRRLAADDPDSSTAVSMAKSHACDGAVAVAGKAMQLHGGIGYTWESGIHVYLKRATLNRALFGSPTQHRKLLAARHLG